LSLDATVYRRGHGVDDDDCTDHEIISRRLGNIAGVGYLRARATEALPADSVLLQRVLASGSHAGDALGVDLMPAIKAELAILAGDRDPEMRRFAQAMWDLAEAAVDQANPICF
jgi:hypothetical protein